MAAVLTVSGCASPPNNDRTELRDAEDGFPALDENWHAGGQFVNPEDVLRITEGQTKDQVRQLIGNPHFTEGFFGVQEWNYVFNLYTGVGNDYITCQYQVHFNDDMALESTRWRDAQCPSLLAPIEVEEIAQEPRQEKLTLSGDVLFDFDSDQLSLEGQRALARVAQTANSDYAVPSLFVVGYTDRFGSEKYNAGLSQSRAEAAGAYLSSQGIDSGDITMAGRGEADPVVECPGAVATPSVKACLKPNRRVEFTITESVL
ncbi:OmpA family protein [Halomonas sp. SpR8]|uniref:OmpA family protein n=1 Tax=Halomonas sp. SpR8 TaxID=3050463 RepID=UPI0027E4BA18|nr:OmpA family protein [Halomonas sp. SpR8]MDQ7730282.1 outer membrane protein assembly factor BamE [Halomonas sp. SpR8]